MALTELAPQNKSNRFAFLNRLSIVLSGVGLVIASFLSAAHQTGAVIPCGASSGCAKVAADSSSMFYRVPVAHLGVLGYTLLILFGILRTFSPTPIDYVRLWAVVSAFGTAASAYYTYHSITVIQATCTWCIASAIVMTALFGIHIAFFRVPKPMPIPSERHPIRTIFITAGHVLALGGGFVYWLIQAMTPTPTPPIPAKLVSYPALMKGAHFRGPESAPVTIVEFADLYCGACMYMHDRIKKLMKNNPGTVRLAFHHYPLVQVVGHELSATAATRSEMAATDGKFWDFVDRMFTTTDLKSADQLNDLLKQLTGKTTAKYDEKLAQGRVSADMEIATKMGIKSTPTYLVFVDGKYISSAEGTDLSKVMIRPEVLKKFAAK